MSRSLLDIFVQIFLVDQDASTPVIRNVSDFSFPDPTVQRTHGDAEIFCAFVAGQQIGHNLISFLHK